MVVLLLDRMVNRCRRRSRAESAENYPWELINEMLRGMRDTADFEEEWGDETEADLDHAMLNAGLLDDMKFTSLVAAYRAQDLKEETERLSVKFKYKKGKVEHTKLVFKDTYKDEYTCEELPMGHVRLARILLRQGTGWCAYVLGFS